MSLLPFITLPESHWREVANREVQGPFTPGATVVNALTGVATPSEPFYVERVDGGVQVVPYAELSDADKDGV